MTTSESSTGTMVLEDLKMALNVRELYLKRSVGADRRSEDDIPNGRVTLTSNTDGHVRSLFNGHCSDIGHILESSQNIPRRGTGIQVRGDVGTLDNIDPEQ